jgi:hypothetical protein
MLDAAETRYEPWPYDAELPTMHSRGVTLPADEPGVASFRQWSPSDGVAIPVCGPDAFELGRFVVVPRSPSVGVVWKPSARARALDLAERYGSTLAEVARFEGSPAWPT